MLRRTTPLCGIAMSALKTSKTCQTPAHREVFWGDAIGQPYRGGDGGGCILRHFTAKHFDARALLLQEHRAGQPGDTGAYDVDLSSHEMPP